MLKIFRRKIVAKIVLWSLLILILPGFILYGIYSRDPSRQQIKYAGIIDNKNVPFSELYQSLASVKTQVFLNYFNKPEMIDSFLKNRPLMAKVAWDRLIMLKEARKRKIKVSDKDVVGFVQTHPLFVRDGRFDDRSYVHILRYSFGLEPRGFEEIVRENLEIRKLNDIITKDVTVNDEDVAESYKKDFEKFKLSYIAFEPKAFLDKVTVDEAAMKDYYENHKNDFVLPDQDKTSVRQAQFDEVKEMIRTYLAEIEARKAALASAEEAYKKISKSMAANETLEASAAKLGLKVDTTEPIAKSDYVEGMGEADKIIETAASLKDNQVSAPIETKKGAMIIKLVEIQKIDEEKFKKERPEHSKVALDRKKTKVLEEWLRGLEGKATLNITFEEIDKYLR